MRRLAVSLFMSLVLLSCGKEPGADEVTYEVTLVNSKTWTGSYLNENAELVFVERRPSGWKHTFRDTKKLRALVLATTPDTDDDSDAVLTIRVNGKVFATGTYRKNVYLQVDFNP